ncbi:hypothetical protein [uncultured Microbacterium sp.]|uniref:hypothetical protein n=1 Tax=uncultured Microbacterium sp. TaxID=191216 RepID=UPI0028D68A6F|nr:hypothetical protein [uncultured Microbacterium sp.]
MSTESPFQNDEPSGTDDDLLAHDEADSDETFSDDDGVLYDDEVTPEYGILGFTLRELLIVGAWAVGFVASFFPYFGPASIWGTGIHWILPIGLPTVAVFLLVLRRFSPDGIRRVGSLGIDQFASVAFSVSAVFWLAEFWNSVAVSIDIGSVVLSWNGIVQLIAALALVVFTVFAPLIPGLKEDFHGRLVTLAHRNANPVRPVIARPRPVVEPAPAGSEDSDVAPHAGTAEGGAAAAPVIVDDSARHDADLPLGETAPSYEAQTSTPSLRSERFDTDSARDQATDEVARLDLAEQVPLASHASGGDTGTEDPAPSDDYVPTYSRRTWNQEPEIVSDTGSIESLMGTTAQEIGAPQPVERSDQDSVDNFGDSAEMRAADAETTVMPTIDDDDRRAWDDSVATQPFWILAQTERDVHDERGDAIFRIGPSAWVLVIEDRGGAYVVRHDDGRIGYLHDIADITRG